MRFSVLQMMAFAVLAALTAGLVAAAREHGGLDELRQLRFTNDGNFLTGIYGDQLHVWKLTGDRYQRLYGSRRVDAYLDMATWEVRDDDGRVSFVFQVFDAFRNEFRLEQYALPFQGSAERVFQMPAYSDDISVSRNGDVFALRIGGVIEVRDWSTQQSRARIPVTSDWQADTCLSPDGQEVLHVDEDSVRIWSTASGKLLRKRKLLPEESASRSTASYSFDGRLICVFRNNRFRVFDAGSLQDRPLPEGEQGDWSRRAIGVDPWHVWMPGEHSRLIAFTRKTDGVLNALMIDLDNQQRRSREVLYPRQHSGWVSSVALSPNERWCAVSQGGAVDLIDLEKGTTKTIFAPRPTVFAMIYSIGFIVWAIVWGRMSRRGVAARDDFAQRESRVKPGAISGAFRVLGESAMAVAIIVALAAVAGLSSLFGPESVGIILVAVLPAILFALYRAKFSVRSPADRLDETDDEHDTQPLGVPSTIVAVWIVSALGGLLAIAAPVAWMMHTGWVIYPFTYYTILVGVAAIAQASACSVNRLSVIAWLQLGCILSCDLINFLIGVGVLVLLQRPEARVFQQRLAQRRRREAT